MRRKFAWSIKLNILSAIFSPPPPTSTQTSSNSEDTTDATQPSSAQSTTTVQETQGTQPTQSDSDSQSGATNDGSNSGNTAQVATAAAPAEPDTVRSPESSEDFLISQETEAVQSSEHLSEAKLREYAQNALDNPTSGDGNYLTRLVSGDDTVGQSAANAQSRNNAALSQAADSYSRFQGTDFSAPKQKATA